VIPQENLRMMKKGLLLTALLLALPFAAFAGSSVDFTNGGGTLSGTNSGLTLTGSTLIAANGLGGGLITGSNLGTVSFSTGALSGGTLQMGGTFAAGGSFSITGNGTGGIPNGVIFNGSFTGPVTWTLVTLANGTHNYTLSGSLTGTWYAGGTVDGATVQLTINTGHGFFNGQTTVSSGDTNFTTVPEPGTLSLLGTGLIAVGGVVRRKLRTLRG
jgi:PEP-CTERM motif